MGNNVKIGLYGDFTLGENYQAKYDFQNKVSLLRQKGYNFLFEKVKNFLYSFDLNIVNLETQITDCMHSELEGKKAVLHWNDPKVAPSMLLKYQIGAVSLGNNHGYDYKEKGLIQTIEKLNEAQISYFGAGMSEQEAARPFKKTFKINEKDLNLYIFGGYKYREDYDKEFNFYAKGEKSGIFLFTPENVAHKVKEIKENDPNSFLIAFPHFGFDLQKTVPMQKDMARRFIDMGFDTVVGHGPHMINQIEYYKSKPIIYSLGNFIFPADFKGKCLPYNLICSIEFGEKKGKITPKYKLYGIYMDNSSMTPQTRLITNQEAKEVLNLLCEADISLREKIKTDENDPLGISYELITE